MHISLSLFRRPEPWQLVTALAACAFVGACGPGRDSDDDPPPPLSVTLTADKSGLSRGETTTLRWASTNATTITNSNFGATDLNGAVAIAPTASTTYTLTVGGAQNKAATATATVSVDEVAVGVTPTSGAIPINKTLALAATVTGAVDNGVTWAVQEPGGGTITPDGANPANAVYTAPGGPGVFHVVATSNADPGKTATVEIRAQIANGTVNVR